MLKTSLSMVIICFLVTRFAQAGWASTHAGKMLHDLAVNSQMLSDARDPSPVLRLEKMTSNFLA